MPSDHPDSSESSLSAIRAWIAEKRTSAGEVDLDQDLIESRIIDSLDFAEFLFFLEDVSGRVIDLAQVELDTFRSLRSIQARFLSPEPIHG